MSSKSTSRMRTSLAALGIGTLALAATGSLAASGNHAPISAPKPASGERVQDDGYVELVEAVMPAVVNVRVTAENPGEQVSLRAPGMDPDMQEFFERFFGRQWQQHGDRQPQPKHRKVQGEGSGFFIDSDGHVLTNAHVVHNASQIEIVTQDGTVHKATLRGIDEKTDLAVLDVETDQPTPYVAFADSDEVRVGERVVAVGNPFGLGGTVTSGIVSATGRELGAGPYDDFLQIDASINRGNSGGPTFNLDGEVVGVNSMIFSPSGGSVGIGFAIASNLAEDVSLDLLDDGAVERGWLGVNIQSIDRDLASALGLDTEKGVLVSNVMPDSPAETAGIEAGDVIHSIDGATVDGVRDVTRLIAAIDSGTSSTLGILRDGEQLDLDVEIGAMPNERVAAVEVEAPDPDQPRLGLRLQALDPEGRERLGVDHGLIVSAVEPDSPAAGKNIRAGDVVLEADGREIASIDDLRASIRERHAESGESILLRIARNGDRMFVAVPFSVS